MVDPAARSPGSTCWRRTRTADADSASESWSRSLIHAGIFAITWPTIAQAPPREPEQVLIPVRLVNLIPPEREVEPISIEAPLPPPPGPPVIASSSGATGRAGDPRPTGSASEIPEGPVVYLLPTGSNRHRHRWSRRGRSSSPASTSHHRRSPTRSNRVTPSPRHHRRSREWSSSNSSSTPRDRRVGQRSARSAPGPHKERRRRRRSNGNSSQAPTTAARSASAISSPSTST